MAHIIFIAGAGQDKTAWDGVAALLTDEHVVHTFTSTDLTPPDTSFSIRACADELNRYMTENNIKRALVCGLSLGAMIATDFTIRYPQKVAALVLCGSQVHPNPLLMSLQSGIMKALPEKLLGLPPSLTKKQLLAILRESVKVDFRDSVHSIKSPTLVVCGAKDTPNLSASRYLAKHISGAILHIIPGVGHQINIDNPQELHSVIEDFTARHRITSETQG